MAHYSEIDEILEKDGIDCVDICVPTSLHHDMVLLDLMSNKRIKEKRIFLDTSLIERSTVQI